MEEYISDPPENFHENTLKKYQACLRHLRQLRDELYLNIPSDSGFLEKDIEKAIINKLQQFMLEMVKGFSFVAQQKRISAEDEHFYVDLCIL
jgi:predicted nuclease of restriction endonuclease-like (RecB) superfamily